MQYLIMIPILLCIVVLQPYSTVSSIIPSLPSLSSIKEGVGNASSILSASVMKQGFLRPFKILPRIESRNLITGVLNPSNESSLSSFYDVSNREAGGRLSMPIFRRLNLFSLLKKSRNKDFPGDLSTSESSPVMRFTPYHLLPPPPSMIPNPFMPSSGHHHNPFGAASMRYLSYHYPPYPFAPNYHAMRRMTMPALSPRMSPLNPYSLPPPPSTASLPLPVPAYFPLGSMTGTPILDPAFHAALASSLSNRYTPASMNSLSSSLSSLPTSLYDDFDFPSFSNPLKRYFRPTSSMSKFTNNKYRDEFGDPISFYSSKGGYSDRNRAPSKSKDAKQDDYKDSKYDNYSTDEGRPESFGPVNDAHSAVPSHLDDAIEDNGRYQSLPSRNNAAESSTSSPKFKEKQPSKESPSESYVDVYGWRGPPPKQSYSDSDDGSYHHYSDQSAVQTPHSAGSTGHPYGSRSASYHGNSSPSTSSSPSNSYSKFDGHPKHDPYGKDLDAASSDKPKHGY